MPATAHSSPDHAPVTTVTDAASRPLESFADPAFGAVKWQTLLSRGVTPTADLTCGLAHLDEGDCLALHSHPTPEVYFGIEGTARMIVDGESIELRPGVTVYIPRNAVHGIFAESGPAKFFYVFATDGFEDVEYHLMPVDAPTATVAEAVTNDLPPIHPGFEELNTGPRSDILPN